MPWNIDPETGDHRRLHWDDVRGPDGKDIAPYHWDLPTNIPGPETWPLPFRQTTKHKKIPDICGGRYTGVIFVSKAFKALVEDMDPVAHHFIPLHIYHHDGHESIAEHFLFKFGSFVDAIVIEQSEVKPMRRDDGVMWRLSHGSGARITWRASAIQDRHVWADKYRNTDMYCSDVFMKELKSRKMGTFDMVPSFVSQDVQGGLQ
jgi:hypothetical protein